MIKSIQTKIILIFFILGIIIIGALSIFSINSIKQVEQEVLVNNALINEEFIQTGIDEKISQIKAITAIEIGVFTIITILVCYFTYKAVVKPIKDLIQNAEKVANGEEVEFNKIDPKQNQIEELSNAFDIMTKELKQNLNEVAKQKKQIETILLHMTDGIIAFDMEGNIIYSNPAAMELLNLEREKQNTFKSIFEDLKTDINLEKIVYLENWTSSEQRIDVGDKFINLLFAPFQDENDKPDGVIVVIQDITEHVKLDNMRKEFVADVSHELKTPITSIMGYADTLLESEYDKEMQTKFLEVISSEARRMARLVTDLLVLSRYDNKKVTKEESIFDLGEVTKNCIERLRFEVEKKNIILNVL